MRKTLKKSLALVLSLLMLLSVSPLGLAEGEPEDPPHTHVYTEVSNWLWDDDYSSCAAKVVCSDESCGQMTFLTAEISEDTTAYEAASCINTGKKVVVAEVTLTNGEKASNRKEIVIPALGHDFTAPDLTDAEAVAARVNLAGDGVHNWKCIREGCTAVGIMQLKEGTEDVCVPVTDATVPCTSTGDNVKTCTSKAVCDVCGAQDGDTLPHDLTEVPAVAATCLTDGNIGYWKCNDCGAYFSDAEGNTEIKDKDSVVIAKYSNNGEHKGPEDYAFFSNDGGEYDCTEGGYKVKICAKCGEVLDETHITVDAMDHVEAADWKYVGEDGGQFDCTKGGYRTKVCKNCEKELGTPEVLAGKDHNYIRFPEVPATCTESGLTAYRACSVCKYGEEPSVINPLGHKIDQKVEAVTPDCTHEGNIEYWKCTRDKCGKLFVKSTGETGEETFTSVTEEGVKLAKTAHTFVLDTAGEAATCTDSGKKDVFKCSVCGQLAVAATAEEEGAYSIVVDEETKYYKDIANADEAVIPMLGHQWIKDEENDYVAPTCISKGSCNAFCSKCGTTTVLTLDMIPHESKRLIETVAPTCLRGKYEIHECKNCGQTYEKDLYKENDASTHVDGIEPLAHEYSGFVTTIVEPTCTETGIEGRACLKGCGTYLDGNVLPAKGHSLADVREEPVGHTPGYYGKQCSVCGEFTEKEEISVPAECLDTNGDAKCGVCGKILCDHMCHSENAFMKIVWFVVRLWYQFLGINETCDCGIPHYTKASSIVVPD